MAVQESVGYSGLRISKKQEKLYKATSVISRNNEHKRILVKGISQRETLHDAKEILSGVPMPGHTK